MLASLPILSTDECAHVRRTLHAMRPRWIQRGSPEHPFYTIGAASYIDANTAAPRYAALASEANPLLREHFGWLHARVMYALSIYLQALVRTDDALALPGFHVWEGLEVPRWPVSVHFDLQYLSIPWPDVARADQSRPLSFTLPIALPREGGGLNSWDLSYPRHLREIANQNQAHCASLDQVTRAYNQTFHPYECGVLAVHSGHIAHQIAAIEHGHPDDERITLQGHGLYCDGAWTIYW